MQQSNPSAQPRSLEYILEYAARRAGEVLRAGAFRTDKIEWKHEDDPVTDYDKAAEECIRRNINASFDMHHVKIDFTGEEGEETHNAGTYRFIMDPLDGTKKYIRQDFGCATSIGVEKDGELVAGAVYDFMRDIMYLSTDKMRVIYRKEEVAASPARWGKMRIVTEDLHKDERTAEIESKLRAQADIDTWSKTESIALAMAKLAAGVSDGLIVKPKRFSSWDVAAGYHMLRTKGFDVTDIEGNPFDYRNPRNGIIAIRPDIDEKVRAYIR